MCRMGLRNGFAEQVVLELVCLAQLFSVDAVHRRATVLHHSVALLPFPFLATLYSLFPKATFTSTLLKSGKWTLQLPYGKPFQSRASPSRRLCACPVWSIGGILAPILGPSAHFRQS